MMRGNKSVCSKNVGFLFRKSDGGFGMEMGKFLDFLCTAPIASYNSVYIRLCFRKEVVLTCDFVQFHGFSYNIKQFCGL